MWISVEMPLYRLPDARVTEKSVSPCPSRQTVTHKNLLQKPPLLAQKTASKVAATF
ncbi:hypothetical protein [Cardiobacterium valvarum]|uniref:hypothetical protein n=1 Tax=Cardiobacterium valvarum TaxID=194702 RepID=UPI001558CD41|nr:hypothetical protein [Cardiobacterium valvarum]